MITKGQVEGLKAGDVCYVHREHLYTDLAHLNDPGLKDSIFVHDGNKEIKEEKTRWFKGFYASDILSFNIRYMDEKDIENFHDVERKPLPEKMNSLRIPSPRFEYYGINDLPSEADLYVGDEVIVALKKYNHELYIPVFEQLKGIIADS